MESFFRTVRLKGWRASFALSELRDSKQMNDEKSHIVHTELRAQEGQGYLWIERHEEQAIILKREIQSLKDRVYFLEQEVKRISEGSS